MLVNILLVTNSILNLFFGLVLGIVCYSSIKRINKLKNVQKNLGGKK